MSKQKPSDQLVDAKAILEAAMELKRRGNDSLMKELESIEVELAGFILEEESQIHLELLKTGAKSKLIRRLIVRIESLALVSVLALRKAQYRLWCDDPENSSMPNDPPQDE